jgi:hypothetical protein
VSWCNVGWLLSQLGSLQLEGGFLKHLNNQLQVLKGARLAAQREAEMFTSNGVVCVAQCQCRGIVIMASTLIVR